MSGLARRLDDLERRAGLDAGAEPPVIVLQREEADGTISDELVIEMGKPPRRREVSDEHATESS